MNETINEELSRLREENQQLKNRIAELEYKLNNSEHLLEEKNKRISDSINYAQTIQNAIMPPMYHVKKFLPDSFILYKPKDVVSGDFYFVEGFDDYVIFSAVDCTGHGVPGALMSVLGFNCLYTAVVERKMTCPADILNFLDIEVNRSLRQTHNESGVMDGMDLSVCSLNLKTRVLQYAGAFNQIYYIKNGVLTEIKADNLPIGINTDGVADVYTNHIVQMEPGNTVYLFTDGIADQFGGPNRKKFMYKRLREVLLQVQHLTMEEQKSFIDRTIEEWKGNVEQYDDMLLMGIKIV